MKKLIPIAVIGAALLSTSAMASPANGAVRNTFDVQEIRDSSVHNVRAAREAFKHVRGVYAMDDGTTLLLYQYEGVFVAELSGKAPVEVIARKNGTFVAVNGTTEFRFVQNAGGQVANVVLTKSSQAG